MLREVNPKTAHLIETTPHLSNPNRKTRTVKLNEKVDKTYQRVWLCAHESLLGLDILTLLIWSILLA